MKLCPKCHKQFSDDANFCPVDAARLQPIDAANGADGLSSRFKLGDKLGGGRTGAVYRATDTQSGQAVAVKLIAPAVLALPGVAQRLDRELKQLERVASPGVAKVITSGKRGDDTWIALELIEGAQTLAEAITARGAIPLEQAANLIEVIGEALIEAAQVGVVHRDLAPKNVLIAPAEIKLINFSLPVPTERVAGVPEFVAPEQVDGKPVDQRSNLYSLGALYYYVLTGQPVHSGSPEDVQRAHVNASIKTPSSLAPVPAPVEAVIMRALDRSPTKRFLTVRQFVDEVARIARGETTRTTQPLGMPLKPKAELVQTLLGVRGGIAGSGPVVAPVAGAPASAPVHAGTVIGVASGGQAVAPAASVPPPERSPWAPPPATAPVASPQPAPPVIAQAPPPAVTAPGAMAGAQAAIATAAPELARVAPTVAPEPVAPSAPKVAAPVIAAAPAGKKQSNEPKGKFRETMWFKKGDLDAQAAQAAAEEAARGNAPASADKADTLPIDERYKDDGTITRGDKEKYSLRTGGTQMMSAVRDEGGTSMKVSEDALIGEMKSGRQWVLIGIAAGIAVLAILLIVFVVL